MMSKDVIVIGAGTAGMEAAGQLAKEGYAITLLEKEDVPGGHLKNWYHLFPNRRDSKEVMSYLTNLVNVEKVNLKTGVVVNSVTKEKGRLMVTTNEGVYHADAVVVATGFDLFRCERKEEYGYGIYDNVISSADLEAMLRKGAIRKTDGTEPARVGFIHCVGSRDEKVNNRYCSKLCCVSAVKQAMEVKEQLPNATIFCFYMDIRMGGALYEELYRESQEKYGVNYIRGKVSEVSENIDGRLVLKAEDTLVGRPLRMELDMLVLMAGMEMSESGAALAAASSLSTGENRFLKPADYHFASNKGNIEGVFYAGTCTSTMNITETISHARAAVEEIKDYFSRC